MANSSVSSSNLSHDWCTSWTEPVYLYGYLTPGIALFIFGFTFNPIALYYFATSRNFRRSAYSYYFSTMAIVDLARLTLWCLFLLLDYKVFKLNFRPFECPMQTFSESVASSISAWLTVALSVERCLVIYKPLHTLTDIKGKHALIVIPCVILASCAINSVFLQPGFYVKRVYVEEIRTIVCYYHSDPFSMDNNTQNQNTEALLTPNIKRIYLLFIVIIRVAVPFMLILTMNIILLGNLHKKEKRSTKHPRISLVRHGHHRKITPMILFSSCILLLTISPRYLLQFYVNFFQEHLHCSLVHLAPHLLKTLELFNYSFNVFVSVVSGKHGRYELFNMLLCRSQKLHTKQIRTSTNYTSVFSKSGYQRRSINTTPNQKNPVHTRLLVNNSSF